MRVLAINSQKDITIKSEYGTIILTLFNLGVAYSLSQHYLLNREIKINTKAINVQFNDKVIEYNLLDENGPIKDKNYVINGKKKLALDFFIKDIVKKGDVITITAPNFITCEGKSISLEKLTIEIDNEFK